MVRGRVKYQNVEDNRERTYKKGICTLTEGITGGSPESSLQWRRLSGRDW